MDLNSFNLNLKLFFHMSVNYKNFYENDVIEIKHEIRTSDYYECSAYVTSMKTTNYFFTHFPRRSP